MNAYLVHFHFVITNDPGLLRLRRKLYQAAPSLAAWRDVPPIVHYQGRSWLLLCIKLEIRWISIATENSPSEVINKMTIMKFMLILTISYQAIMYYIGLLSSMKQTLSCVFEEQPDQQHFYHMARSRCHLITSQWLVQTASWVRFLLPCWTVSSHLVPWFVVMLLPRKQSAVSSSVRNDRLKVATALCTAQTHQGTFCTVVPS
jgi:hypothetical protein